MKNIFLSVLLSLCAPAAFACIGAITDENLCETPEILFSAGDAAVIKSKAQSLGSVVNIYEYIRNGSKYSVYQGARSNSINTFLSQEGNDVDLATTLIAMYRSVGVKSRYAVGKVRLKRADISNWIAVENNALAVSILKDQGLTVTDEADPAYVLVEHVWVEALVNFANYRGANKTVSNCTTEDNQCKWVALDPSFKLRKYDGQFHELLNSVSFDYDSYYKAETNQTLKNKNPLEIFEETSLKYLRTNYPGRTLEDVIDAGEIIKENLGLLPSSLPYEIVGVTQKYTSLEGHDSAVAQTPSSIWGKRVVVSISPIIGGIECASLPMGSSFSVAELSTKKLTVNWGLVNGATEFSLRLDGAKKGLSIVGNFTISCNGASEQITAASRFNIKVQIDASPSMAPIEVKYENLVVGGYYLIATGGETSNWSQVRRAYESLLSANKQYPILNNDSGVVFVDENKNGLIDAADTQLLQNQVAQDALTGGLLYVAQSLYYTKLKENSNRYSRLKNIVSPIAAYVGIVSTTYEVEKIGETPFAVLPGGLLIDLKGIRINGSWIMNAAESYSNETFKFLGHIASSLEHEVWQELTGYDAVSTMRGIQLALKTGASLVNIRSDNFEASLGQMGIDHTTPPEFLKQEFEIFGRKLVTWKYSGTDKARAAFYIFRGNVAALGANNYQSNAYLYRADNGFNDTFSNYDNVENQLNTLINTENSPQQYALTVTGATNLTLVGTPTLSGTDANKFTLVSSSKPNADTFQFDVRENSNLPNGTYNLTVNLVYKMGSQIGTASPTFTLTISPKLVDLTCNGSTSSQITLNSALSKWQTCFEGTINSNLEYMNFLDRSKGFDPSQVFYKPAPPLMNVSDHGWDFISTVRNNLYFNTNTAVKAAYTAPTRLATGPNFLFDVYVEDTVNVSNNNLLSSAYIIKNESMRLNAGGGYVPEGVPVIPATNTEGVKKVSGTPVDVSGATFNNEVFTDKNIISISNNDVIRTPSTSDPVSTVTGNMYHDETDVVIEGKGMPYAFTRTYNSNETSTDGPGSSNTNYLPLSQGWTHSYNMKLVSNDYGRYPNYDATLAPENNNAKTSSITYVDERGGEANYLLDDSTTSTQPTSPRAGFDKMLLNTPSAGLHQIVYSNGAIYTFDSQGIDIRKPGTVARLVKMQNASGNQLNFLYTNNNLSSITDDIALSGRSGLTLSYYSTGVDAGRLQYVTDWSGRKWEYRYTGGQLTSVINPLGDAVSYTYVPGTYWLKDIVQPEDRNGTKKTMTFSYYENGQAYSYVDKNGSQESLIYDLFRRKTAVTSPLGFITEHSYDNNGALIKLVGGDNGIHLFENNTDGLRFVKYNALGQRTRYSYNTKRDLTGVASDTQGQITREEDPLGNTIDYTYGLNNQVTSIKDKNGNTLTNIYYSTSNSDTGALAGKLQKTLAAKLTIGGDAYTDVLLTEYKYYPDGMLKQKSESIDPAQPTRKRVTDFTYSYQTDGSYTATVAVSGSGNTVTTKLVYDTLWRLKSSALSRRTSDLDPTIIDLTTSYSYDALGRVIATTDPLGNIAETVFDKNGQIKTKLVRYKLLSSGNSPLKSQCTIDPAFTGFHTCVLASNTYDAADRLTSTTDIMGAVTRYEYDAAGQVKKVTNDLGNSLYYDYDAAGNRTTVTDEKGYSVKTKYDLAGNVTAVTNPNNQTTYYTYDAMGHPLTVTSPEGRVTKYDSYDGNGNLIRMTDPNATAGLQPKNSQNASAFTQYDEFNRPVSMLNANNEETKYTFDLLGNRTSVTDARNQATKFIYDDLGRLVRIVDPIIEAGTDKVITNSYDEAGNRLIYTDRIGRKIRSTYDKLNRLTKVEYITDAKIAQITYDQYGDQVSTDIGGQVTNYVYDAAHRPTSKTDTRKNLTMKWEYNKIGNLINKTNYQGEVQHYNYDKSNRLVSMSAGTPIYIEASYHYDPAGRLLSRILSSGVSTLYNYSNDGYLTSVKQISADGTQVDLREYVPDNMGNIHKLTINNTEVIDYTYDPAYRLLTANSNVDAHDLSYTYDAVGNRKTKTVNGQLQTYIYPNGNRLGEVRQGTATGPLLYSFDYDDNGSMIKKKNAAGQVLLQFNYDQRGLASSITELTKGNTAFTYDANAFRISKQNGTEVKNYYLDGEHLESVYNQKDELQATYLRGAVIDEIINGFERSTNGVMENRTYHHDQVNSVVAVTDHNGKLAQAQSFGPFGELFSSSGTSKNPMQFTGREQDSETGLYYYRARYYDPDLGRFISEDPIGFNGGINFYAYVGNNPLGANDPSGKTINKVLDILSQISDKYKRLECRECADEMISTAESFGLSGTRLDFQADGGYPFLYSDKLRKPVTENGGHSAVEFDELGLTFDNFTPNGLPKADFIADLNGRAGKTVKETPFGGSYGYAGATSVALGLLTAAGDVLGEELNQAIEHPFQALYDYTPLSDLVDFISTPGCDSGLCGSGVNFGTMKTDFSGANGGFLIYPNKINTNSTRSVYSKQ